MPRRFDGQAAKRQECSPQRELWVRRKRKVSSPEGAKETDFEIGPGLRAFVSSARFFLSLLRSLIVFLPTYPRLAPGALFLRRFAAGLRQRMGTLVAKRSDLVLA